MTQWQLMLLTVFGLGRLRPAPGTYGSLPPVVLVLGLLWLMERMEWWGSHHMVVNGLLLLLCCGFSVVCLAFGARAEQHFGRKDASPIVADEVAGQSMTLLFLPWRTMSDPDGMKWNASLALIGFVSFRLCDIIKPPPARSLQRLRGGWGVLIDDLIAGLYAAALTQVVVRLALPIMWS